MSLAALSLRDFFTATAAKQPTPGGGAVAAVTGALGSALGQMVVSYSLGKKSLTAHQPMLERAAQRLERARDVLLQLADEDAAAYGLVNELTKLPEADPRRQRELPGALLASVQVPLAIGAAGVDVLRLLHDLCGASNQHLRSDLAIAAVLCEAAARSAQWNVVINAPSLPDEATRTARLRDGEALVARARELAALIESSCKG